MVQTDGAARGGALSSDRRRCCHHGRHDCQRDCAVRPHRMLILGGGFAGAMTAQALERRLGRARTSRSGWSAATTFCSSRRCCPRSAPGAWSRATSSARCAAWSVTTRLVVHHGGGEAIDTRRRPWSGSSAVTGTCHRLHYDTLVLALGGITHTFGIPGIAEQAAGMKTLADAFSLRNRIIEMFERAELEDDQDERRARSDLRGRWRRLLRRRDGRGARRSSPHRVRRRYYRKIAEDELRLVLVELKDRCWPICRRRWGHTRAPAGPSAATRSGSGRPSRR